MTAQGISQRSAATRARLIAVAERLFASRGVDGASLSEINRASGQRNANACQYHFGNKEGLLQAIVDKHVPAIAARRNALLDQYEAEGTLNIAATVHAWVTPVAEKLDDPDGGPEFILVNAQLTPAHTLAILKPEGATLRAEGVGRLVRAFDHAFDHALNHSLAELSLDLRRQRLLLASILLFHGLADHIRLRERAPEHGADLDNALFVRSLKDAMVSLLASPPSVKDGQSISPEE